MRGRTNGKNVKLPTLTNDVLPENIPLGVEVINAKGEKIVGTLEIIEPIKIAYGTASLLSGYDVNIGFKPSKIITSLSMKTVGKQITNTAGVITSHIYGLGNVVHTHGSAGSTHYYSGVGGISITDNGFKVSTPSLTFPGGSISSKYSTDSNGTYYYIAIE